jgi:drug/metabolite transporter (DMT)-like permease
MLIAMALLNSASFVLGTVTHIEALKHVPAGVVYPILRLNMVVVVLFGVFVLGDRLSPVQVLGIFLAIAVMVILRKDTGDAEGSVGSLRRGLFLLSVSLLCGSVASISSKYAALYAGKLGFMALSYFLGSVFSAGLIGKSGSKGNSKERKEAVLIGIVMGLINFAGFYAFLAALSVGPLAVIVSITGMHFVIAVMLSVILYKEKLGPRRVMGIALTVASVLFLRS